MQGHCEVVYNNQALKAQLNAEQKKNGVRGLVAAPTCWGSIKGCCKTLLMSERILHAIVSARDFIKGTSAQKAERAQLNGTITSDICSLVGEVTCHPYAH
jgi:hypothetical protein